ncbi:hypothetical protein [Poseidonibacter ostreae]|uniref:Uncharacterized protein n=1 Tax=Poseidonibacter ostreae TaxID=2654171 RepID=A0A6L4WW93_9BACT|nr:hypothetical protein [Poseidonibacter ostreae]KAB7891306.1 hypothetical protein GBG19_00285 [Poseidonibacter ostreae]
MRKNKLRLASSLLILTTLGFSNTQVYDVSTKSLSEEELEKQLGTEAIINNQDTSELVNDKRKSNTKTTSSYQLNNDNYEDISIYNYLVSYNQENNKKDFSLSAVKKKDSTNFLADNITAYNTKMEKEKEALAKALEANKTDDLLGQTVFMSGYCYTDNTVEIEQVQGYSVLDCTFDDNELNIDSSRMMAMFVPLTSRNALIAKPIYLQKNSKKLPIEKGVILTVDRTSMNVANFINDKKLKKLTADVIGQTGDVLLSNSVAYMEQKEASETTTSSTSTTSVSGTSTTSASETKAPDISTYLVTAGVQLFSTIIKGIGILMSEDKYPLFKVYKQSGFYVDFVVEIDSKNKKTLNYMNESYDTYNKNISIGEDVAEEALTLPVAE